MTNLEKQQFFALYWGQKIGDYAGLNNAELNMNTICHVSSINVKPLSKISDEDYKHIVCKISGVLEKDFNKSNSEKARELTIEAISVFDQTDLKVIDFLRSKGYALPWREYAVEDLVNLNVIKLLNHNHQFIKL